jgi:hypothetical protein
LKAAPVTDKAAPTARAAVTLGNRMLNITIDATVSVLCPKNKMLKTLSSGIVYLPMERDAKKTTKLQIENNQNVLEI